jgi:hypothetical protein
VDHHLKEWLSPDYPHISGPFEAEVPIGKVEEQWEFKKEVGSPGVVSGFFVATSNYGHKILVRCKLCFDLSGQKVSMYIYPFKVALQHPCVIPASDRPLPVTYTAAVNIPCLPTRYQASILMNSHGNAVIGHLSIVDGLITISAYITDYANYYGGSVECIL